MKNDQNEAKIGLDPSKKTIVFIHYFGGNAQSWQWLKTALGDDYTCILLNLPGFGKTTALDEKTIETFSQFINETIKDLELEDYTFCGHSMGAKLAVYAASKAQKPPREIILVAPSPPTVEKMPEKEKKRMLNHPNLDEAITTVKGATLKKLDENKFQHAVDSQLEIEDKTWDWWLEVGMHNNIAAALGDFVIPTHVICSQDDPVIPMDWIYNEVLPYFKNNTLTILEGLGHLIPMEAPEILAQEIKNVLK